ncbi:MAG: DNA repair protein RadC [Micromonosporaceae bacterium]|nr:DNA repair protein RadC [Micromonosporaceae bacterium]
MRIIDLPRSERPRERLAASGASALAERELLAVLLGTGGARGVGAHDLAERLLARFGSVAALARAHPADLAGVSGIGPAKAAALVAAFELARRGTVVADRPLAINNALDVVTAAGPLLRGRARERLIVVLCDHANRVLGCDVISEGSADRALLPVREVVVAVLRRDGKAFALAHNHPSGDPTPSGEDIDATWQVREAAAAVGLRFLDHVVVTDTDWRRVLAGRESPHSARLLGASRRAYYARRQR